MRSHMRDAPNILKARTQSRLPVYSTPPTNNTYSLISPFSSSKTLSMPPRNRIPAGPASSRSSVAPTPARRPAASSDELPPYRKPSHPLNTKAQDHIRALNGRSITYLKENSKKSGDLITTAAGLINDKLREREEAMERRRKRWERGIHTEDQEEEEDMTAKLQEQVEEATKRLEESMRAVIDGGEAAQRIEQSLMYLREHAPGQLEAEYQTQMSQQQSQRRRRTQDSDGDDGMGEENELEDPTPGPTPLDGSRPVLTGISEIFNDRQTSKKDEYTSISLVGRYSKNDAYVRFKEMVHDAKYPQDSAPPLPKADTWFTDGGSPAPGTTQLGGHDDDDDLVIDKERISTRCPLTFQQFKEPITSDKCKHTFEKNAILEMIRSSNTRVGGGAGRGGAKAIVCPRTGCDQVCCLPHRVMYLYLHSCRCWQRPTSTTTRFWCARSIAFKRRQQGSPRKATWTRTRMRMKRYNIGARRRCAMGM